MASISTYLISGGTPWHRPIGGQRLLVGPSCEVDAASLATPFEIFWELCQVTRTSMCNVQTLRANHDELLWFLLVALRLHKPGCSRPCSQETHLPWSDLRCLIRKTRIGLQVNEKCARNARRRTHRSSKEAITFFRLPSTWQRHCKWMTTTLRSDHTYGPSACEYCLL